MPDQRRKWLVAVVLFWMVFFGAGVYASWTALFNPLLAYLRVSRARLAVLPTIIVMVASGMGPGVGWLLDRIAGRWVAGSGLLSMCVGLLICAGARSFEVLFWGTLLTALGWGCISSVIIGTLIARWFTSGRGLAMGVAFAGSALGASALLQVSGYVIRHFGWRWAYVTLSVPALLMVPLTMLFLGNPAPAAGGAETSAAHKPTLPGLEFMEAITSRSFWLVSLAMILFWFDAGVLFVHSVPQLIALGFSSAHAVAAVSLGYLLAAAAKPVFGSLADKFGVEKMLAFCFTGAAVGSVALVRGNLMPFTTVFVVGFMLFNVPVMLFPTLAAEVYGVKRYGTLWGLNLALSLAGQALGPALAGGSFDRYGSYTPILMLCAVVALIAALLPFGCVSFIAPELEPAAIPAVAG